MGMSYAYDIPSRRRDVLDAMRGARIARLVRFSWWPPDEVNRQREQWGLPLIPDRMIFSLTSGPLGIWLDSGVVVGFASDSSLISVTLRIDQYRDKTICGDSLEYDQELFAIDAFDDRYTVEAIRQIVGQSVINVSVLKRKAENPKWEDRPREAGVALLFETGVELVLSHGLYYEHDDDFQVIMRDQIHPTLATRLVEARLENLSALASA